MYTLRINNQVADLQENFDATLSYSTIDFINPLDRTGGYTYSINIPFTKTNNKIFNFVNQDITIDKFKIEEFDAVLDFNQATLISGIFYLDSITSTGFRGQIVSDTLNWTKNIPDDNISDLTGFTVPFPQDLSFVSDSIEETLLHYNNKISSYTQSDFVLPFISYGNYNYASYAQPKNSIQANIGTPFLPFSAGTIIAIDDFFPCNFYVSSIKNLFSYMGYNVECSLFNSSDLKNKIIAGSNAGFKWNWGTLGTFEAELTSKDQDYFKCGSVTNVEVDSSYNPVADSGSYTYYGWRYTVRYTGKITIEVTGDTNASHSTFIICTSDSDYTTLSLYSRSSVGASSYTATLEVNTGDFIFVGTEDFNEMDKLKIYYPDEDVELNYQKTLPKISCKDYLKNFINMYNLYPYFNPRNNTVYLYTLQEFVQSDKEFIVNSVNDFEYTKYVNSSIGLAYTYDTKDALVIDKEYDYNTGADTVIQLIFSPTKTRDFVATEVLGAGAPDVGITTILSIASADQINLDRLNLSLADTVDYLPWNDSTTYSKGDLVEFGGLYWTSIKDSNLDHEPTPLKFNWWIQDFLGEYNTDKDYDYTPRILEFQFNPDKAKSYTGVTLEKQAILQMFPKRLNPPDYFYLVFQTAGWTDDLDLEYIYNKYYGQYRGFVNNRTSLLTGRAYIPLAKFIKYFNKPYEVTYLNDVYILLGISNYNPNTEIGTIQMIKKINMSNWE